MSEMDWQPGIGGHPGLDWEVSRDTGGYYAELLDKTVLIATVRSRTRLVLAVKMRLADRRWRR